MRNVDQVLTPAQRAALASLRNLWPDARMILIGATALRLQRELVRITADVDIVIAIEAAHFPGPLARDPAWAASPRAAQPQRWTFQGTTVFDLLPVGHDALSVGHLTWPGEIRMNIESFDLLMGNDLPLALPALGIHVAPVPLIMLLKMVAWLDRPERVRDIADLTDVLANYLDPHVDAEFDRLIDAGYGHDENAHARLLGEDIARYGRTTLVRRFLGELASNHAHLWARHRRLLCEEDSLFAAFKLGLGSD